MINFIEKHGVVILIVLALGVVWFVGYARYHYGPKSKLSTYEKCIDHAGNMRNKFETEEFTRYVCNRLPQDKE